ncbi:MAG TPA: tyrosine--tRNA ligase [Planctomycetota bacterium]|nr:tyrosine--tRNA ligase [Planctomycetota bacterium]
MSFPPVAEQLERIRRGTVDLVREEELAARLERSRATDKPLRVKLGIDPTFRDVHLGHSVVLRKLRDFQDLGHQAVLILGDGTALVGDPTGRDATRPALTRDHIEENVKGYLEQISRIVDVERAEVIRNGRWFHVMGFADVLRLLARGTVARMIERDNFQERIRGGKAIHLHELLYPLMQGWDSVMVRADVELGGTDQLFNLMQGRQLQEEEGQPPQICVTTPLLEGLDGRKMSKSYGNHVGLTFDAKEVFGKTMSIPDAQLRPWLTLLTRVAPAEIDALLAPDRNPRDAKVELAKRLVAELHGPEAAGREAEAFSAQFSRGEVPVDMPTLELAATTPNFPAVVAKAAGISASEVRRLMSQRAVTIDGEPLTEPDEPVAARDGATLKVGKRRWFRVRRKA